MKRIAIPPSNVLEREVKMPAYAAHPEFHLFPPIAVIDVPRHHPFKETYNIDYLCLDGHKRLASAHVRKDHLIQARVAESKKDICRLFVEGGMDKAALVFSRYSYDDIIKTFLNPRHIVQSLESGKELSRYMLDAYGYAPRVVALPDLKSTWN